MENFSAFARSRPSTKMRSELGLSLISSYLHPIDWAPSYRSQLRLQVMCVSRQRNEGEVHTSKTVKLPSDKFGVLKLRKFSIKPEPQLDKLTGRNDE